MFPTVYRRACPPKSSVLPVNLRAWSKRKMAWPKNFSVPLLLEGPFCSQPWGQVRLSTALLPNLLPFGAEGLEGLPNLPSLSLSESGSQSNTNSMSIESAVFRIGTNQTHPKWRIFCQSKEKMPIKTSLIQALLLNSQNDSCLF